MLLDSDGLTLSCEVYGEGMPLIALHGWGVDHRLMSGCLEPCLSPDSAPLRCRRFYPDLPGMGKTAAGNRVNGSEDMLNAIIGFIGKAVPEGPFLLAGESYGGYLARGLLRRMPERVAGLLLIAPAPRPRNPEEAGKPRENVPARQVIFEDREFLASLGDGERSAFREMGVRLTKDAWNRFSADVLPGIQAADRDFLEKTLGANPRLLSDPDAGARPFFGPTLIVTGRQDSCVGYRESWSTLEDYPRATFAVLDGAGHNLQTERVPVFEALVTDWLERVADEIGKEP